MTDAAATKRHSPAERPRSTAARPANDGGEEDLASGPASRSRFPTMDLAQITGDYSNAASVNARFDAARLQYHLVSPASTSPNVIPAGCSIVLTAVHVHAEQEAYPDEERDDSYALKRPALHRIGQAAGVEWRPEFTRRTDDASHPYYCSFSAFGTVRLFDGQKTPVFGSKAIDLRDGSALAQQILEKDDGPALLRRERIHILSNCETKATLRAIRMLGLRSTYTAKELLQPFIVARLIWTGATDDPELARFFALRQMDAMVGASRGLYGEASPRLIAPGPPLPVPPLPPAPAPGLHHPAKARETPLVPPPSAPAPAPRGRASGSSNLEPMIKFGKAQGVSFSDAKTVDLTWYARALKRQIQDPEKSHYRARNQADLHAANQELGRRGERPVSAEATADREDY